MKYSRLPQDELKSLEQEFIDFLVVTGIIADDWVNLKKEEPKAAEDIINQFSDVVWEGVLRKVEYLEKKEDNMAYYFKCDKDKIHLIKVQNIEGKVIQQTASKPYAKVREQELFDMIGTGCSIADSTMYNSLT